MRLLFLQALMHMRQKTQTILISFLLISIPLFNLEVPKRAFRLYERGDLEKTVETLEKSLEKDSLNPAAYFLYTKLYTDTAFQAYNVEKAHEFVLKSFEQFRTIQDEKDLEDLKEVGVDSLALENQKDLIDSLRFEEVKAVHQIGAYNTFIEAYNDAKQVPEAIALRDQIAFGNASEKDTWESYLAFAEKYPESAQYNEADSLYKLLIYQEKTADGKLDSYKEFLEEFPGTPYREEILPEIFRIQTATNRIEDYRDFLSQYPSKALQQIAYQRIYHVFKEKYGSEDFLKYFPWPEKEDSIRQIQALEKDYWIPKLNDNSIEFLNSDGESQLKTELTSVSDDDLCEPILNDFVVGSYFDQAALISRDGDLIYSGDFDHAKDAGYGFVILENGLGERLIHKSGELIIDEAVSSIKVLNESFIRTEKNGFFGLKSIQGIPYLQNEFIEIDTLAGHLWLEKENGIALIKPELLFPALDGETVNIEFSYDDVALLDNGRIWVSRNGEEAILDSNLRSIIPFGNYEIYDEAYGWKLISDSGIKVIHDKYPELVNQSFEIVEESQQWLAGKKKDQWTLYDQLGSVKPQSGLDSVQLLGENMALIYQGDAVSAQFKNGKQVLLDQDWGYSLLVPQSYIQTGDPALHDFFMLSNSKKYRKVYNEFGREILTATFNEVVALDPNMLRLQKRNAAIADSTGHYLVRFVYDGIGSNDQGYVSLLDRGKFGVINPAEGINIPPEYDKLITPYSDTVLVATEGQYKGFINTKNEVLTAFEFDEVQYFNDSIALVRIEDEWLLENIKNEEILYEFIEDFEIIDVGDEDKTLFINTETGQGIFSETLGEVVEPTFTYIRILGTQRDPIYFAVKLVDEADIYVVIYYDKKGNKLFTQSFRQEDYFKIACPLN